jgi:hypothetical protein
VDFFLRSRYEQISFVYRQVSDDSNEKVKLSGYGFEIKPFSYSMEYKRHSNETIETGYEAQPTELMKQKRIIPGNELPEPQKIPAQLVHFAKSTKYPFKTLLEVSENFPIFSSNISKIAHSKYLMDYLTQNFLI